MPHLRSLLGPATALVACALALTACARGPAAGGAEDGGQPAAAPPSTASTPATMAADTAPWQVLFDGHDLSHWQGFKMDHVPPAWHVENGAIALSPSPEEGEHVDLVTKDRYHDFELELEWKISPGGNSGIMYRVGDDRGATWATGPEMQVLDNERAEDNHPASHRAGALYDLYAPSREVAHPAGEWNRVRIVVHDNHVEHWLNGTKIVDYVLDSPDWKARVAASKFATMPGFGTVQDGRIALQDHGSPVWYRNIRIRVLGE